MSKIKEFRKKRNMTQEELARILGVHRTTVAKWESGDNIPKSRILLELSKALECKVDVLLQS